MSSKFSGVLQLTDLNDFITPSQECIKPIEISKNGRSGSVFMSDDGSYFENKEDGTKVKLEKARITLNDCLACSGCITSAESILISEQSQEEFSRVLEENNEHVKNGDENRIKTVIVSMSPQSTASLAAKYEISIEDTAKRLTKFFHDLGVSYVLDTTFSREFALLESGKEFVRRYKSKDTCCGSLPMLSSACPGWICYAEKTHGDYILPHISTVKSPQQIMGTLVKDFLASKLHRKPHKIYHVSVMPCFDKKLEASRSDFYNDSFQTRDVDCVITSIEIEDLLEKNGIVLTEVEPCDLDDFGLANSFLAPYTHDGSTSGGYCNYVFTYAAKELFGETIAHLEYTVLRNQDLKEIILEKDGEVVLRFAVANGFRNIQNIVQKLKRGKSPYQFVEIMACPSGCANGGAQIRPMSVTPKEFLLKVEELYFSVPLQHPSENVSILELYDKWLEGEESAKARMMLHTQYHAVEKFKNPLLIKW